MDGVEIKLRIKAKDGYEVDNIFQDLEDAQNKLTGVKSNLVHMTEEVDESLKLISKVLDGLTLVYDRDDNERIG